MLDSPSTKMCRLLALSDGTVINQSPISPVLCSDKAIWTTRLKISKDYRDGEGESQPDVI